MSKVKSYEDSFKEQIVKLVNSGKSINQTAKEYNNSGSFKDADNRTTEDKELIALRKRLKQLEMENDILKQAMMIMKRK